jgi:hypothetical protein
MPVVDTTRIFTNNEQITSTKLNEIMDNSSFVSDAVVPNQGLQVTAGGQMQIPNGGIKTALLENSTSTSDGVTTAKIADLNVTASKLAASLDLSGKTVILPNNSVTPANLTQKITSGTAVTASGTSIDFTSIPSWVQRISLVLSGCSTGGSSIMIAQLGTSSGFTTTGYLSYYGLFRTASPTSGSSSIGFGIGGTSTNDIRYLIMTFVKISGNQWVASHSGGLFNGSDNFVLSGGGNVTLSGTLDRIRLTTTNGTDTFDAGSVNIVYE